MQPGLLKQRPGFVVRQSSGAHHGEVVMGSQGHAVLAAGGWCRVSSNYAQPSFLLRRLQTYIRALKEELRLVGVDERCCLKGVVILSSFLLRRLQTYIRALREELRLLGVEGGPGC